MKKNILTISLFLIIIILTITIAVIANIHHNFKENISPLQSLIIKNTTINLQDKTKKYSITIPCDEIKDLNEQIIYYQLKPNFQESKVQVSTQLLNSNQIVTDLNKGLTSLNITIDITTPEGLEQLYNIEATCQK